MMTLVLITFITLCCVAIFLEEIPRGRYWDILTGELKYKPIPIPKLRRVMPTLIASDIIGVQPMTVESHFKYAIGVSPYVSNIRQIKQEE